MRRGVTVVGTIRASPGVRTASARIAGRQQSGSLLSCPPIVGLAFFESDGSPFRARQRSPLIGHKFDDASASWSRGPASQPFVGYFQRASDPIRSENVIDSATKFIRDQIADHARPIPARVGRLDRWSPGLLPLKP